MVCAVPSDSSTCSQTTGVGVGWAVGGTPGSQEREAPREEVRTLLGRGVKTPLGGTKTSLGE